MEVDEDYIRAKLAEAQEDVDHGRLAKWDVEEFKRRIWEQHRSSTFEKDVFSDGSS